MWNYVQEEEYFFDCFDFIQAPSSPSSSFECANTTQEPRFYNTTYDRWRNELQSVDERRRSFLSEMGFGDLGLSNLCCSAEIEQVAPHDNSVVGLERISTTSYTSSACSTSDTDEILDSILANSINTDDRFLCSHPLHSCFPKEEMPLSISGNGKTPGKNAKGKKWRSLFKKFKTNKLGSDARRCSSTVPNPLEFKPQKINANSCNKMCKELTELYMLQRIQAHKSPIRAMKFSLDGKYLASGSEDGVIRIWEVNEADSSCKSLPSQIWSELQKDATKDTINLWKKISKIGCVVNPKKMFGIEEVPFQEFHGHAASILDLSWSKNNCLLSASEDKTVRMWQVGSDKCVKVFYHSNYVTCIQFNPADEKYFLSGSIDGKVRIWGVSENRVVDWADVSDIVTAVCYQPDGQGIIVGSMEGNCHFYSATGNSLELKARLRFRRKRNSRSQRITGFQFSLEHPRRVMITSADSRVRILDDLETVCTYRGSHTSGSQKSASFTSSSRHIVSVDDDSQVCLWNCDPLGILPTKKQPKCITSCEHFLSKGVSVAAPWLGMEDSSLDQSQMQLPEGLSCAPSSAGFFEKRLKQSATWPEDKLSGYFAMDAENNYQNPVLYAPAWGLVIVTGGWDGEIRCYQNFGLPI